jgi:hypothetical protein
MTMFAKTILIAALMLAGTSLSSVASASTARGQVSYNQYAMTLCPPGHSLQECFYGG